MMDSFLEKLACVMSDESTKLIGVHKQLQFLHDELSSMRAFLEDVDDTEGLNKQTMAWRNEVRELTYEIEDCIDDFRHRVEGPHERQGLIRKAVHLLETLMARYQIATKIKELRTRVQETSDRRTRYKPDECVAKPAHVAVDPRITALYAQTSSLVGIDGPTEEVIKLLTKADDMLVQELKVVSIVGFGGLGKTTLANEVYRRLAEGFSCRAFISVSQRPDMMSLLKNLFSKVSGREVDRTYDLQSLIDNLREYLDGKRYLFVIDDIWDASAWEIIKCAFPESHCGSRVLTTTRIESVAVACCSYQWQFVYKMKSLDENNSRQLFYGRVGLGSACLVAFKEPGEKILRKCGGLPLAIVTVASLLASQPTRSMELWNYVLNSLRHNLGSNSSLEGMRQILDLSYTHLPHRLKTCFLYIGMYPEDYEIGRDDLVVQLIAEGFISGEDRALAVEEAGSYLNELVNRSLIIQVVRHGAHGERINYKVHDMVLDLILHKTMEENFLSVVQKLEAIKTTKQQYKSRRLSLQFNDISPVESAARIGLPHVRSLIIFGWPLGNLGLLELKFLRVLFIQLAVNLDLTRVGELFQLRYLCIRRQPSGNSIRLQLPREISALRHLETLIIQAGLSVVPQDIVYLPALSHIVIPLTIAYPHRIGLMKSLDTLLQFDPSRQSMENISDLGELLNLRVLELVISSVSFTSNGTHMDALMSSLEKLINCRLRNLSITARDSMGYHGKWSSLCISSCHLEKLHLYFRFPRIPVWVSQLVTLSSLKIKVAELYQDDVAALAGLPRLAHLIFLDGGIVPAEGVVFSSDTTFKVLNYIKVPYVAEAGITFQAGSTPQVETIRLLLKADEVKRHGVKFVGIEHLPNLKKVLINLRYGNCDESDKAAVKAAIRSVFDAHPARSGIQIEFY